MIAALRFASRRLRRSASYTISMVVALSLGIGVTTAIFALVNAALLRPLPYPDASRLVGIRHTAQIALPSDGLSTGLFLFYQAQNRVFEKVGVYQQRVETITAPGDPEQLTIVRTSPGVFSALRVTPLIGRVPIASDFQLNGPSSVLISHALWQRRFGGDRAIVGRTIELDRSSSVIVGVARPGFQFPDPAAQVWLGWPQEGLPGATSAGLRELALNGLALLKAGVSPSDAERDLLRIARLIPEQFPTVNRARFEAMALRPVVPTLHDVILGDAGARLWLLLATALFLLLLTWANATNLTLVHAERQRKDIALERALGATTGRLAMRCFAEASILGALAGALGFVLAAAGIAARFGFQPGQLPRLAEVGVDGITILTIVMLASISTLLVGGVAFLDANRPERGGTLTAGLVRTTGGRQQQIARRVLVGAQIAIAFTLLIASGLMAQSFWRLMHVEMGFEPESVFTFGLTVPPPLYRNYHATAQVHASVLDKLRALPGVQSAEAASRSGFPITPVPSYNNERVARSDQDVADTAGTPFALFGFATPGYFAAMGIPMIAGRAFQSEDMNGQIPGVILSASLSRALFGDREAIGQRIRWATADTQRYAVVGVAGDVPSEGIQRGPSKVLYFPNVYPPASDRITGTVLDYIPDDEVYAVRTALPPASVVPAIRRIVRDIDPKLVVTNPRWLNDVVARSVAGTRLTMLLLVVASLAALAVGIVGIYGIQAYAVSQRTAELGVRIALGASPAQIILMVVRQGGMMTLGGIIAGVVAAAVLGRLLRSLLYDVSPGDPLVFAAVAGLLAVVGLLASYLPARQIGRLDLVQALKGN